MSYRDPGKFHDRSFQGLLGSPQGTSHHLARPWGSSSAETVRKKASAPRMILASCQETLGGLSSSVSCPGKFHGLSVYLSTMRNCHGSFYHLEFVLRQDLKFLKSLCAWAGQ